MKSRFVRFGNILDVTEGIIMHGCNAQGVMGSGLAFQVRDKYPECFARYAQSLKNLKGKNISPVGLNIPYQPEGERNFVILNCITQENFGRVPGKRYVSYEAIYNCFENAALMGYQNNMHVHYPMIGAGLGGGDWAVISDLIEMAFHPYPEVERSLWLYDK